MSARRNDEEFNLVGGGHGHMKLLLRYLDTGWISLTTLSSMNYFMNYLNIFISKFLRTPGRRSGIGNWFQISVRLLLWPDIIGQKHFPSPGQHNDIIFNWDITRTLSGKGYSSQSRVHRINELVKLLLFDATNKTKTDQSQPRESSIINYLELQIGITLLTSQVFKLVAVCWKPKY